MAEPSSDPIVQVPPSAVKIGPVRGWGPFWWTLSLTMHGVLAACIVYFTPLRQWFFARPSPEDALKSMQGMRLGSVVANLFDVHVKRIKEKVKDQQDVLRQMAVLRGKGWTRYRGDLKFYSAAAAAAVPATADEAMGSVGPTGAVSLDGLSVAVIYTTSQAIEKATYETYRQIRAIELARLQNLPLKEASENTSVAIPPHDALEFSACEPAFLAGIVSPTDGKLETLRQQLTRVRCEVEAMVAAGYRMLDYAHGLIPDDVG